VLILKYEGVESEGSCQPSFSALRFNIKKSIHGMPVRPPTSISQSLLTSLLACASQTERIHSKGLLWKHLGGFSKAVDPGTNAKDFRACSVRFLENVQKSFQVAS
jgi:hypothetical protein